ncbi:MAG TPA: Smr/MutS family protein [Myxococcales bacterium]|nr:Smr/MutS family protein [Myxococcales bacterium]
MGKKAGQGFNTPFKDLKQKLQPRAPAAPAKPAPARPAQPPGPARPAASAEEDEARMFYEAVAGAAPLQDRGEVKPPEGLLPRIIDENAEALAQLSELVSGEGPFDIADSDEFIQGHAPGVNELLMAALRRGEFSVQGHLDLHGMSRAEAKEAVERFVFDARRAGKRCVLLIHGRGLNSRDQIPVLKEALRAWLQRGRIARAVLAFATARPHDGGAGAVYVVLRK